MVSNPSTALRARRRTTLAVVLVTLGALLAFTGPGPFGSPAAALSPSNGGVVMTSINTYSTYPTFTFGPGCSAGTTLTGLQYAVDADGPGGPGGAGAPVGSLAALGELPPGSTVIMTWSGWASGCTADISLSVKRADSGTFDFQTNQELISYVGCNGNGAGCAVQGGFRLELTMPSLAQGGCHYQVDAVVGAPLDVVGPNGSFYSNSYRQAFPATMNENGANMLIHANNGRAICLPPTTTTTLATTTTTLATTTSTTLLATTTTTTEPGSTTTTTDPGGTTTTSVLSTTLTQPSTSTTGAEVLGVTVTRPGGTLARTGAQGDGTRTLLAIGLVLAGLGVALFGHDRKLGWLHRSE